MGHDLGAKANAKERNTPAMSLPNQFRFGGNIARNVIPINRPVGTQVHHQINAVNRRPLVGVFTHHMSK